MSDDKEIIIVTLIVKMYMIKNNDNYIEFNS